MIITEPTTARRRVPMTSLRKTALIAGVVYLITFISIPTLALYGPVRDDPTYILGPGPTHPPSSAPPSRSSSPWPVSAPPSCCTRWSNDRTRQ